MRPAEIQVNLRIRTIWSKSSLGAFWVAKDANLLHADNKDTDQTARMQMSTLDAYVGRYAFFFAAQLHWTRQMERIHYANKYPLCVASSPNVHLYH